MNSSSVASDSVPNVASTGSGQFNIQFTRTNDNALCCGIEILIPAPATPTGLSATPGSSQAGLAWNSSAGATGYNIKRATVSGGPYTGVGTSVSNNYTDSSVTNGITYYYVVSAVNGGGESSNSTEANVTPLTPLQLWRQTKFGTTDPNDPVAGDMAIPKHDGVANLMKYALGLDPTKVANSGLPAPGTSNDHLNLTFNRQQIASDITYRVEGSDDLATWTELWNSTTVPYGGGNNASQQVTVTDSTSMSAAPNHKRFMRLKVTRP